jgi:carbon-monoxide dehydrogenase large subunit
MTEPGTGNARVARRVPIESVRPHHFVGQRLRRREDARLVSGKGRYLADLVVPGMRHAAVLRSVVPHGRIVEFDASEALSLPGVDAVFSGRDLIGKVGPFVEGGRLEISPMFMDKVHPEVKPHAMPVLAADEVHFVGQPVAVVVADSRYLAEDALELVRVEYEELPVVTDPEAALAPGAPVLHGHLGDNVAAHFVISSGDVDAQLARAPHVYRGRFEVGRQASNAMEPRGVLATSDAGTGDLTVWCTTARPHLVRTFLSEMLGIPLERIRVICPDMGGSFGTGVFSEDFLIPFVARELGRPVRWVEDRSENLLVTRHGRDQVHDVEVGYDDEGRILALKDRFVVDAGAYNQYAITVSYNAAAHARNQFDIPAVRIEGLNVLTNKAPVAPVRGAGRPEVTFMMDRVVDVVAHSIGIDPVECRRRNLVRPEQMPYHAGIPYRDGVDIVYDRADFPAQLAQLCDLVDYAAFRKEQAEARREGRRLGIGFSSYMEGSGFGPHEGAVVRVDTNGHVTVYTGANAHGQGLATTLAQVCADQLGVTPDDVTVRMGDTSYIPYGIGTFASRSAVTAGTATGVAAALVHEKALAIAAELLEVSPSDLELEEGMIKVIGTPSRKVSLGDVARAAMPGPRSRLPAGMEPVLEAEHYYVPPSVTWSSGTHAAVVEVDEETGFVRVLRYLTVDDCGQMLNPTIVEGQVHGGVALGLGEALTEEVIYDSAGQPLTGTYMDYLLPTTTETPPITVAHQVFPSELNPFGIKGCGEGGAVGPPAAIANAIVDALRPLDVRISRVPIHPERLLELIEEAKARPAQDGGARPAQDGGARPAQDGGAGPRS